MPEHDDHPSAPPEALPCGLAKPTPTLRIVTERKAACVLNPSRCTEAFNILEAEAEAFETRRRIRRHAAKSQANLDLVSSLMTYRGGLPLCSDPADRFEAYLCLRSPDFYQDLLALLDMPDAPVKPTEPELSQAA